MSDDKPTDEGTIPGEIRSYLQAAKASAVPGRDAIVPMPAYVLLAFITEYRNTLQKFSAIHDDMARLMEQVTAAGVNIANRAEVQAMVSHSKSAIDRRAQQYQALLEDFVSLGQR